MGHDRRLARRRPPPRPSPRRRSSASEGARTTREINAEKSRQRRAAAQAAKEDEASARKKDKAGKADRKKAARTTGEKSSDRARRAERARRRDSKRTPRENAPVLSIGGPGVSTRPVLRATRTSHHAEVQALDFTSPTATATINGWCARKTNNKIKEIVKQVDPTTFMYLINAVYFKGTWTTRFEKKNTRSMIFRRADGSTQTVQMMNLMDTFRYASSNVCDYLEMDYGNRAFSMVVMLPKDGKTTQDVIATMDGKKWADAIQSLTLKEIHVLLPRFKAECEYPMHEHILPDMGMKLPFNPMLADLSGIADVTGLYISKVIHKTFVQVDEEGTEAAGITLVGIEKSGKSSFFFVDRPFLFVIREKSTGVILFIGEIGEI